MDFKKMILENDLAQRKDNPGFFLLCTLIWCDRQNSKNAPLRQDSMSFSLKICECDEISLLRLCYIVWHT